MFPGRAQGIAPTMDEWVGARVRLRPRATGRAQGIAPTMLTFDGPRPLFAFGDEFLYTILILFG